MVNWGRISRELRVHVSWAPILTSIFLTLTGYLLMNMMIVLFCETQEKITAEKTEDFRRTFQLLESSIETRLKQIRELEKKIQDLFSTCDIRLKSE